MTLDSSIDFDDRARGGSRPSDYLGPEFGGPFKFGSYFASVCFCLRTCVGRVQLFSDVSPKSWPTRSDQMDSCF
jgi:hypothetical protein